MIKNTVYMFVTTFVHSGQPIFLIVLPIASAPEKESEKAGISFFSYLAGEVSHSYLSSEDERMYSEKQKRVSTFLKAPLELEKVSHDIIHTNNTMQQ